MQRLSAWLLGGRLLYVLIFMCVLVAILSGILNVVVISRVINDYLANAQADRVGRDMDLANGFYQLKLSDVSGIGERTAVDTQVVENIGAAVDGNSAAIKIVDQVLARKITVPMLGGSQAILILDQYGNIVLARTVSPNGQLSSAFMWGNWGQLSIVRDVLASGQPLTGTEIIPGDLLSQLALDRQAQISLRETPQDAPRTFDPREGTAGLALTSVYPLQDANGQRQGVVVTVYLFNNDFSFVDYIKNVAKIETTTVFLGDLRVSTNVRDTNGVRAVGTRASQNIYDRVLVQGQDYLGQAFVVNEWYTGRYEPLRDHSGNVVGMLYAGVREKVFKDLVYAFNRTAILVAVVCMLVAGVIAFPIAKLISRPIVDLVEANQRLAQGEMDVRVEPFGRGEIAQLDTAFNNMAGTLQATERELLHKEKLASMGQLAAGVAHELNNPLSTILLYSDVMYKDVPADDPRREDLKMIIDEAYRCKVIVADLLNFARHQEVLAQDTDLRQLVEEVITKVAHRSRFEGIDILRDFSPDLPLIQADPAQLQQVFINLMNNSADAMHGGTITVSAKRLDEGSVEIRVADTGSGILPENLDKLFTPFFTTKPVGKGTGLGLSIVYGIIKMHRGQIHVESQPGKGTTIVISLPIRLPDGQLDRSGDKSDLIG
jgi:two-component system, NtrC family, sensor kinase